MDLILWRHAEAFEMREVSDDLERALTPKGDRQAQRMAAWLNRQLPSSTRVLVSPARRAQQTAEALDRAFETHREVATSAGPQSLLKFAGWPDGDGTVLVVGHQPTLGQAAALALTGRDADWSIKKGGLWWLESRGRGNVIVRAVIAPDVL